MSIKIEQDGAEIEVYTAEEVATREAAVRTQVEGEYKPQLTAAEQEKQRLNGLLKDRANEFQGFRKLREEDIAKLDAAQLTIYENQAALAKAQEDEANSKKAAKQSAIAAAIRAKVGTDEKLFTKVEGMYTLVNLVDDTQEAMERRVLAAIGALGTTEPNIIASLGGFSGGSFVPPKQEEKKDSFADSERGKSGAAELGLMTETKK